jgi:hypothetical protein
MKNSRTDLRPVIFCFLLLALLLLAGSVIAAESVGTGVERNKLLIISGKTDHAVVVGERKFVVTEDTAIFNMHGKQIPLSDLAVPCEATVQYRLIMDKSPVVMRVQVKKDLPGATVSPLLHHREK